MPRGIVSANTPTLSLKRKYSLRYTGASTFSAPIFSMTSQSSPRNTMTGTGTISAETLILPTRSVKRHFWILSIWTRSRKSSITAGSATGRKASSFKNAWIPGRSTPRILRSWSGMNPIATFTQTDMWKKRTKEAVCLCFRLFSVKGAVRSRWRLHGYRHGTSSAAGKFSLCESVLCF